MSKKKSVLVLLGTFLFLVLLGFTTIVGFGPTGTGAARNIITGLDLSVSVFYL